MSVVTSAVDAPFAASQVIPPEVAAFRARFPIFADRIHLGSNSMGAVSDALLAANQAFLDERLTHGAPWRLALPRLQELRHEFARLIGAKTTEVAVCASATQALGVVSSCFDWRVRPGIVFDEFSFPSVTYLWRAQQQRGARIHTVPPDAQGLLNSHDFLPALDLSTQVVSVAHVCYKNGHRLDLSTVAKVTHNVGAFLIVDDYQACGSMDTNVQKSGVDVLVTGTTKYLLGSPGLGLLYVREELHDRLHPTITGWFGQEDPHDFQIQSHRPAADARRFETGTPAFSSVYESLAAIQLLNSVGMQRIEAWINSLTSGLMRRLTARGYCVATPLDPGRRGAQVAIRADRAPEAVAALAQRGILCTQRDGNIRTAWHYYNTPADVDALMDALDAMPDLISHRT